MKRISLITFLCLLALSFFSCNENNSISISQALATSQPRDGKRWKSAEIVFNSQDNEKVDAVAILANDGLYIINKEIAEKTDDYLKTPTLKNNMKDADGNFIIKGLIRNVYVPSNYDSSSPKIIVQCVSVDLDGSNNFYYVDLSNLDQPLDALSVKELTLDGQMGNFCSKSGVSSSDYLMFSSKNESTYTYAICRYTLDGQELKVDLAGGLEFESEVKFSNFFESENLSASSGFMILTSTSGDDIKEQEYYIFDVANNKIDKINKLHSLAIRNFLVYDDGKFMGFTQSGTVIHCKSTSNYYYTSDSNYSYNRYSPIAVFRNKVKANPDEPDVTFFGKYTGNGFIIYSYNENLTNNRIYNDKYRGSVQTQGYAENLRSEDISEIKGAKVKIGDETKYCILVLSSENGISTYKFDSILPDKMTYTDGEESRNKVDFF